MFEFMCLTAISLVPYTPYDPCVLYSILAKLRCFFSKHHVMRFKPLFMLWWGSLCIQHMLLPVLLLPSKLILQKCAFNRCPVQFLTATFDAKQFTTGFLCLMLVVYSCACFQAEEKHNHCESCDVVFRSRCNYLTHLRVRLHTICCWLFKIGGFLLVTPSPVNGRALSLVVRSLRRSMAAHCNSPCTALCDRWSRNFEWSWKPGFQ